MAVNKLPQAFDVEPMRLADVDAVMAIEKISFRSPMTAQLLLEEMGREWAHIDVVRDRVLREVVAFSNYWIVADEVHLLNLATQPEARRAGHASRLYRRFGFRAVGVRPNYYAEDQEDAIVMLLDLT